MITSKQRAYLKSKASALDALYQLGKNGIDENYTIQVNKAFDAKEIIKVNVLDNAPEDRKSIAAELAERTDSEVVQIIGSKIVLYKKSRIPEKRELSLEVDKIQ